ncbi:MAG: mechanosensitive ion channel family protein [Anaerolineae bacterium]|nr:mechanosensitive ion channel family protein [Anaerolineae bacterium]
MPTFLFDNPAISLAFQLGLIILTFLAADWLLIQISRRAIRRLEKDVPNPDYLGRLKTIVNITRSSLFITLLAIFILVLLHSLGVNITPVLTGAGIAGLVLSLGAQSLIKDFLNGVLILIEGQYNVGDTIQVGALNGEVERITLRATYLRDLEGRLHVIPNGEIRTLSNLTASWARAVVDLNLPIEADLNRAVAVLENTLAALGNSDQEIKDYLLEAPTVTGWTGMKDWAVQARLTAKTRAGKQWAVAAAMRKRALEALNEAGIRVQIPKQAVEIPPSLGD